MTDLTRDEIREAVEAVPGWKWVEEGLQAFAQHMTDEGEIEYFLITETPEGGVVIDYHDCDGIALLEVTGEEYQINRHRDPEAMTEAGWVFDIALGKHGHSDLSGASDLTTAAVRAVNQWSKTKKETTP